jgi:hypothetical protein
MIATLKSLVLISLATLWPVARASTQSLVSGEPYRSLRPCAGSCFWTPNQDVLGISLRCCQQYLTCNDLPVDNECYCRPDLRSSAVSYLSLCVDTRCSSNAVDFASAVAVYDSYCSGVVNVADPVTTTPAPSGTVRAGPSSGSTPSLVTIVVTQTALSGSGSRILAKEILSVTIVGAKL